MAPAWQPAIVVFLDVDGVLHSLYGEEIFRESCCRLLQQLLLATGAAIVLSSSWREDPGKVALLNEMLRSRRLMPVHDCTRVLNGPREEEICEWLRRHPEARRWVAIDDLDLQSRGTEHARRMHGHFVQTCKHIGLTSRDVELAKAILLRDVERSHGVGATLASPRLKLLNWRGGASPHFKLPKRAEITISPKHRQLGPLQERRPTSRVRPVTSSPRRKPLQPLQAVCVGPGDSASCCLNKAAPRSPSCASDLTSRRLHTRPMPPLVAPRLPVLGCAAFGDDVLAALVCSESSTVDLDQLSLEQRTIALRQGGSPWSVGWGPNGSLFARLIPDGELRAHISRQHLELEWDPPLLLWLRPTCVAPVLINGVPMVERPVNVAHGMRISFCGGTRNEAFLTFTVILRDANLSATGWPSSHAWPQLPLQQENLGEQLTQKQEQPSSQFLAQVPNLLQAEVFNPLTTIPYSCGAATAAAAAVAAAEKEAEAVVHMETEPTTSAIVSSVTTGCVPSVQIVCTFSSATDVTVLPESARSIALTAGGTVFLGRSHQADLFEALLGSSHALHSCISRAHLGLTVIHERPGFIEISNLSVSAVRLCGSIIEHGEKATVETPAEVNLLTFAPGASPPKVETLLTFSLSLCQPEHPLPQGQQQAQVETSQTKEEVVIEVPIALVRETVVDIAEEPDFCLELGGTALNAGMPLEARRVMLPKKGQELIVGRSFQAQLLLEAIHRDALPWVSREHFRLEISDGGTYCLELLSSHPMWLLRFGCRELVRKGQKMAIQRGDLILLYTGASDGTADGVDSFGTLHWSCVPS